MAAIKPSGDVTIAKIAASPTDLFELPKFKSALNGSSSCVFMGHNRAATKGPISTYNAHPYQFDHIVGAHNGTLAFGTQEAIEKDLGEEFPVDSMAIIASIAAKGIEETIGTLRGSWAISYVDLKEGTLNFIRNKDRPLWYASSKDAKIFFWGSEWQIMDAAMYGGYRPLRKDKDGNSYFQFEADHHYSFDIGKLIKGDSQRAVVKKMEGKEDFLPVHGGSGDFNPNLATDPFNRKRTGLTTPSRGTQSRGVHHILTTVEGTKENPYGGAVARVEFEDWAGEGCNYCGVPIRWGDTGITIYAKDKMILCSEHSTVTKDKVKIFVEEITS